MIQQTRVTEERIFPRFLMIVNRTTSRWVSLEEARKLYSSKLCSAQIGGFALQSNFRQRGITDEERRAIVDAGEECNTNK